MTQSIGSLYIQKIMPEQKENRAGQPINDYPAQPSQLIHGQQLL